MQCSECGNKVEFKEEFINHHQHLNIWTCKIHGQIKTEFVVDGTIMRTWNKWQK
jgi:hypothetical protein